MAVQSWSSRIRHDSAAVYQEWRDELITKLGLLVAAGVLAADETNITPGVGALPATNVEGGYAVFHLDDAMHGTAPVYFRFGFGTQNNTNAPRLQITVGTATNGSGVISGTGRAIFTLNGTNTNELSDTARTSYLSCSEGFFGMWNKVESSAGGKGGFMFCRTVDSNGDPEAVAGIFMCPFGGLTTNAFRYAATTIAYTTQTSTTAMLTFNPQNVSSTLVSGDNQFFVCFTITPRVQPLVGVIGVLDSEATGGITFTATPVGSTPHTYIAAPTSGGNFVGPSAGSPAATVPKFAMLWE